MSESNIPQPSRLRKNKLIIYVLAATTTAIILAAATTSNQNFFTNATAQQPLPQNYSNSSTIFTSGSASVKVMPDKVSVSIGVETDGQTAADAAAKNAAQVNLVITALKNEAGVADDQISTSFYNVYPVYDWQYPPCIMKDGTPASEQDMPATSTSGAEGSQPSSGTSSDDVRPSIYPPPPECQGKNVIVGYKASNNLNVQIDATDGSSQNVGKVIDSAVNAGATNISGAYFFISQERQQQFRDGLIADAVTSAKNRAQIAAEAVGMEISGVQSINLNEVYFPYYGRSPEAGGSDAGTPILPGAQEVSMSVSVTFYIT